MDSLHDRLLVRPIEEKEAVGRGIVIPDTAKEKPQEKLGVGVKVADKTFSWKYSRLG